MGITINVCKIKRKLGNLGDRCNSFEDECDKENLTLVTLDSDRFSSPFGMGYFSAEGIENPYLSISYSTYDDFRCCLEDMESDTEEYKGGFDMTLSASGTDNCVSYETATEMLEEFEKHTECAEKYIHRRFGEDDYGDFMCNVYKQYAKILKECIKIKGIIQYH